MADLAMPELDRFIPPDARSDTTRVRQGKTLATMRRVLGASLLLVVVALAIAFPIPRGSDRIVGRGLRAGRGGAEPSAAEARIAATAGTVRGARGRVHSTWISGSL